MKLDTWIKKTGPKNVAKILKVDPSTVSIWRHGKSLPCAKRLVKLHQASKGKVSYKDLVTHFVK